MCKNNVMSGSSSWVEVFRTASGCVYQSDRERAIYVEFDGKTARYDIRCLMRLRKAVFGINLEKMATDVTRTSDVEIISLCACEHTYVLNLSQIIAFRDLLEGTFVMFELNSILQERIYGHPVYQAHSQRVAICE